MFTNPNRQQYGYLLSKLIIAAQTAYLDSWVVISFKCISKCRGKSPRPKCKNFLKITGHTYINAQWSKLTSMFKRAWRGGRRRSPLVLPHNTRSVFESRQMKIITVREFQYRACSTNPRSQRQYPSIHNGCFFPSWYPRPAATLQLLIISFFSQ
jgi:hypothetical protein